MSAGTLVQFNRMESQADLSSSSIVSLEPDQSGPIDRMEVDGPEPQPGIPHPKSSDSESDPKSTVESNSEQVVAPVKPSELIPTTTPAMVTPTPDPIIIDLDEEVGPAPSSPQKDNNPDSSIDTTEKKEIATPVVYKQIVKKMSKKDLEKACSESVILSLQTAQIGALRNRIISLTFQRDKMDKKCNLLQNQVNELSRAIQQLTETYARNPKEAPNRSFTPLKFYRNVAMSVNLDSPSKSIQQKARGPCPNSIKLANMTNMSNGPANTTMVTANGPIPSVSTNTNSMPTTSGQPVKRVHKPTISVSELRNQVQNDQNKIPRKVGPSSVVRNITSSAAAQVSKSPALATKPATNGIIQTVDLTDDTPIATVVTTQSPLILNGNGVRYQVINAGPSQAVQLVQSGTAFQFVTPTPQGHKQLVFQQQPVRAITVTQPTTAVRNTAPVVFRPVNPTLTTTVRGAVNSQPTRQPSPVQKVAIRTPTPAAASGVQVNKVGTSSAIVTNSPYAGNPGSAVPISPRKFVLPELPPPSQANQVKRQKDAPPRTELTLTQQNQSIVLSWTHDTGSMFAEIVNYQIYSCQEPLANSPKTATTGSWKRVGDVKALPLPMACTLSQFTDENRYYFIVRALDVYNRTGLFCEPKDIVLIKNQ